MGAELKGRQVTAKLDDPKLLNMNSSDDVQQRLDDALL
jgi:hypothetical protein